MKAELNVLVLLGDRFCLPGRAVSPAAALHLPTAPPTHCTHCTCTTVSLHPLYLYHSLHSPTVPAPQSPPHPLYSPNVLLPTVLICTLCHQYSEYTCFKLHPPVLSTRLYFIHPLQCTVLNPLHCTNLFSSSDTVDLQCQLLSGDCGDRPPSQSKPGCLDPPSP